MSRQAYAVVIRNRVLLQAKIQTVILFLVNISFTVLLCFNVFLIYTIYWIKCKNTENFLLMWIYKWIPTLYGKFLYDRIFFDHVFIYEVCSGNYSPQFETNMKSLWQFWNFAIIGLMSWLRHNIEDLQTQGGGDQTCAEFEKNLDL